MNGDIDKLQLFYCNADSLFNKLAELEVRLIDRNIDVLVITEALPKNHKYGIQQVEFKIKNYIMISNFEMKTCHRGILIYVRESLSMDNIYCDIIFSEFMLSRVMQHNNVLLHILAIYRSPNSTDENNQHMFDLLNRICSMVDLSNLVIIGDFNLKHIDWTLSSPIGKSPNSYEQQIINCSLDNYLSQHCIEPTRVRAGNESSLLDLIFVKDESIIHSLDYEAPLGKSDHVLISLSLSTMLSRNKPSTEHFRFNLGDYTGMRSQLQEIDWATALEGKSLQEMWEYFSFLIGTLTEQYVPKSKYTGNQRPMWMNTSASDEVKKKKQRAFKKYRYVPTRGNLDQYVAQNKIANKATFKAKKSFELKVASQIKNHPKSFWKYVRFKTNSPQTISDLVENGTTHSDDKGKAVCLNEYFSSVFLRDSNITADIQTDNQSNDSTNTDEPNLCTIIITKEMIAKKLQNLKPDKAAGPDNIFPRILIECQYELLTPLYLLF